MAWCDDREEPECEGFSCPKWGACRFSKDMMSEDVSVLAEWLDFRTSNASQGAGEDSHD